MSQHKMVGLLDWISFGWQHCHAVDSIAWSSSSPVRGLHASEHSFQNALLPASLVCFFSAQSNGWQAATERAENFLGGEWVSKGQLRKRCQSQMMNWYSAPSAPSDSWRLQFFFPHREARLFKYGAYSLFWKLYTSCYTNTHFNNVTSNSQALLILSAVIVWERRGIFPQRLTLRMAMCATHSGTTMPPAPLQGAVIWNTCSFG